MKKVLPLPLVAALAASAGLRSEAAIIANFNDGDGNISSDQYPGNATDGWASGWGAGGHLTASSGVVSTAPLSGGGNYLQVTDNTTVTSTYARRTYQTVGGNVDITQTYTISLSYRFDGNIADFNAFNDRVAIFGDTASASTGTGATNTWCVGVVGGTNTDVTAAGNWYFIDNNGSTSFGSSNMSYTSLSFVAGRTYDISITVNPVAGTYSASINDGVNPEVSASDLAFRRGTGSITASATQTLYIANNASAGTDSSAFSIDNIVIVPEPASAMMALLAGGASCLLRRRF